MFVDTNFVFSLIKSGILHNNSVNSSNLKFVSSGKYLCLIDAFKTRTIMRKYSSEFMSYLEDAQIQPTLQESQIYLSR